MLTVISMVVRAQVVFLSYSRKYLQGPGEERKGELNTCIRVGGIKV